MWQLRSHVTILIGVLPHIWKYASVPFSTPCYHLFTPSSSHDRLIGQISCKTAPASCMPGNLPCLYPFPRCMILIATLDIPPSNIVLLLLFFWFHVRPFVSSFRWDGKVHELSTWELKVKKHCSVWWRREWVAVRPLNCSEVFRSYYRGDYREAMNQKYALIYMYYRETLLPTTPVISLILVSIGMSNESDRSERYEVNHEGIKKLVELTLSKN